MLVGCFLNISNFIATAYVKVPWRVECLNLSLVIILVHKPIFYQSALSLPPENIRKPYGFLMFSGIRERAHWGQMGYVLAVKCKMVLDEN